VAHAASPAATGFLLPVGRLGRREGNGFVGHCFAPGR
jgi:hypothetical protein